MSKDGELYERDPEAWNAYLAEGNAKQARKRVSADAIVRDSSGRILLVDPTYKPDWDLPGGMAEANDRELAVGGIRAQRRKRRAQVAEPGHRKIWGCPQESLLRGGRVGDEREDLGADRHPRRSVGVPLDPTEQRGLADSRDRRRLGSTTPCLPAHLMLEEGAHPQPRTLPAERNRRAHKAPAMDTPVRI